MSDNPGTPSTPEFTAKYERDWLLIRPVIRLLRGGYMLSFVLIAIGALLNILRGDPWDSRLPGVSALWDQLLSGNANGFLGAGIAVMIFTPIIMSLYIAWLFYKNREPRYALISLAVFVILLVSLSFAL